MLNPSFIQVFSTLLLVLCVILFVKNYMVETLESSKKYKNVLLIVFLIILLISSAMNMAASVDLKGVVYNLTKEIKTLSDASIEEYEVKRNAIEHLITILGAIQVIALPVVCWLTFDIKKERMLSINDKSNKWDWEKLKK